jgi:hypothetical protein
MLRIIKFLGISIAALLMAYVVFMVAMRFREPSQQQQAALALLRQPIPPVVGRDGSDALWLLGHEVPEAEQAAVAAELRRYYDQRAELNSTGRQQEAAKLVNPLARYPERAKIGNDEEEFCDDRSPGCLASVRANQAAVDVALRKHQSALDAALGLSAYDGFRNGLQPNIQMEIPRYGGERRLVRTHFAALFAAGQKSEALSGLCADISGWRRLGANSDTLIGNMVGVAYVRNDLLLLAEMMAELPSDEPLPSACEPALQPAQESELDLCQAIRGEFHFIETAILQGLHDESQQSADRLLMVTVDKDRVPASVAPSYARYCDPQLRQLARQDKSWLLAGPRPAVCNTLDRVADPIGCTLSELSTGADFSKYVDRRTDVAAILALTRTVNWLRQQGVDRKDWPTMLRERPANLGLRREPSISRDGRSIGIDLLETSRDKTYSIPLPAPPPSGKPPRPEQRTAVA